MASFFVFLSMAAFVYSGRFGLSPTLFSLAFTVNAMAFIGSTQAAGPMGQRFGALPLMRMAAAGFAFFACALFVLALAGQVGLATCIIGLALGNACLGLIIPTAMVMALDDHGDIAGLASSLGGTLQMLTGGVMVALTGALFAISLNVMIGSIALCALLAFGLSRLTRAPQAALAS